MWPALLEQHMRAVAIGRIACVLAAAKQGALGPLGGEHQGLDTGAGMGAIAEGLLLAASAAAPGVALARLKFHLIGAELGSFRL